MGNPSRQNFSVATVTLGAQEPKVLDFLPLTSCTLAVAVLSGEATYSVEMTLDDVNDPAVTPVWFTHKEFPLATVVSKYDELFTPWRFVRLNIASITGTMSFYVSQSLEASGSF
jgi:hypothetical protein